MSEINERIDEQVKSNPVLLYMKGTPQLPMCGFSARTVEVLKGYGKEFAYVNVLAEPEIRANLPTYSEWPTFPQLFIDGELVGGCDIIMEMDAAGELEPLVVTASEKTA